MGAPKPETMVEKLRSAVYASDVAKVTKLLAKVDPDARGTNLKGDSVLRSGVLGGASLAVIQLLVERGAKLDHKNTKGATPIDAAVEKDRKDVIEYFASKGAKVTYVPYAELPQAEKNARLAKMLESWHDDKCVARVTEALAAGGDANGVVEGQTPLQRIAGHGDLVPLTDALLRAGADPKRRFSDGDTPIHVAARHGYAGVVERLLDAGVEIDSRDSAGNTPLHRAAGDGYNGAEKAVSALLKRGADPKLTNKAGKSVLDVATSEARALIDAGPATPKAKARKT